MKSRHFTTMQKHKGLCGKWNEQPVCIPHSKKSDDVYNGGIGKEFSTMSPIREVIWFKQILLALRLIEGSNCQKMSAIS